FELPVDDCADDRVLVLEVAIHEAGAHARLLRDVRDARAMEPALDEAQARGFEDALALFDRAFAQDDTGLACFVDHEEPSSQPPRSARYSATKSDCSASRVAISPCCAA